jgi:hypothetical protein
MSDAATLLGADPGLIRKAQAIGLRELTANLAGKNSPEDQRGNKPVTEVPKKLCSWLRNHGRLPLASRTSRRIRTRSQTLECSLGNCDFEPETFRHRKSLEGIPLDLIARQERGS